MRKVLVLLLLPILFFLLYKGFKSTMVGADFFNSQIKEEIFEEKGTVGEERIQEVFSGLIEIKVPAHWKYGNNPEEIDFLSGYLPNMKTYTRNSLDSEKLLYGTEKTPPYSQFTQKEIEKSIERDNLFYSRNGMRNESEYFNWNSEKCFEIQEVSQIKKMYTCENWYKWYLGDIKNVVFTYTDCTIGGNPSYCVFADYVKDYFNTSIERDSRCLSSSVKEDDFCDVDEYIESILF